MQGNRRAWVKPDILCYDFNDDVLKGVDCSRKIAVLKFSWIRRIYELSWMETLKYIQKAFGNTFKFHYNLHAPWNLLSAFSSFYKDIINCWSSSYSFTPTVLSKISYVCGYIYVISYECIWLNTFIKI